MSAAWWRAVLGAVVSLLPAACSGDAEPDNPVAPADTVVTVVGPEAITGSATDPGADPAAGGGTPGTTTPTPGTVGDLAVTVGVPGGFPDDFPQPDDGQVIVGSTAIVRDDQVLSVDLTTEDDLAAVVAFYRAAIEDADFNRLFERLADDEEPSSANLRFEADDYLGDVFLTATTGGTSVVLTATIPVD